VRRRSRPFERQEVSGVEQRGINYDEFDDDGVGGGGGGGGVDDSFDDDDDGGGCHSCRSIVVDEVERVVSRLRVRWGEGGQEEQEAVRK